jgi:hypothetical protein
VIRNVLDLPSDPEVPIPGKGQVERAFDLLVDATDGMDPTTVLHLLLRRHEAGGWDGGLGWSLGIEELTGSA